MFGARLAACRLCGKGDGGMKDEVHIAFACNDNYLFGAEVLVSSVMHHTRRDVFFHLLTFDLSDAGVRHIERVVSLYANARLQIVKRMGLELNAKHGISHLSNETYCRLMTPALLPNVEKLLYLDIDLLIRGDVAEIYDTDLSGYLVAGVEEEQMRVNGYPAVIGMRRAENYFNAGVLLMNLKAFRDSGCGDAMMRRINGNTFRFADQDILNLTCEGRVLVLPRRFNFNLYYYRVYKRERANAIIIHFTGPDKPWGSEGRRRWCNRLWGMAAVRLRIALFIGSGNRIVAGGLSGAWFVCASIVDAVSRMKWRSHHK